MARLLSHSHCAVPIGTDAFALQGICMYVDQTLRSLCTLKLRNLGLVLCACFLLTPQKRHVTACRHVWPCFALPSFSTPPWTRAEVRVRTSISIY